MPIIDERGRVFGRLNLVDAAVGVLLLVLLPAAYASYVLFRDPVPKLTAVVPSVMRQGPGQQIEVRGDFFRPYMRVSFNDAQGRTFLFYSPTSAFVQLPDLPPGSYDVVLYDYMQEVSRLPRALRVEPLAAPSTIVVEVTGFLTELTADQIKLLAPGHPIPQAGSGPPEILTVGVPEPSTLHINTGSASTLSVPGGTLLQLPVRIRTSCQVQATPDGMLRCTMSGIPLAPDANVPLPGFATMLNLRVSEVRGPAR